jgi:NAD(P)-dependent dehydrogenase (short-subunit alcohol dehydrogenase family)
MFLTPVIIGLIARVFKREAGLISCCNLLKIGAKVSGPIFITSFYEDYCKERLIMSISLEGKCAVITGAGRGQGREIALAMAARSARVVVNDLGGEKDGTGADRAPADKVVAEIRQAGGKAVANYDSVADFDGAKNIVETCVNNFGRIDVLVNCAGIGGRGMKPFWELEKAEWDTVMSVNINGIFNTCRHALGYMVKQNSGRIINFSSPAWLGHGGSAYTASKGAVVSLSMGIAQTMALEGYHITCNALVPIAETRMSPKGGKEGWERLYKARLINRQIYEESIDPPPPEHIPPIVMYLATDEAVNLNGQVIGASRGRVALYTRPGEFKGLYKDGVWTLEELARRLPIAFGDGYQVNR